MNEQLFETRKILSWRNGLFYFDKADLDEISPIVLRWFGMHTVIDNPALKPKKFAGVIDKNKPLTDFLDNLKTIANIDSYIDQAGLLHFK